MCGIVAVINKKGFDTEDGTIRSTLDLMDHRGPDSRGAFLFSRDRRRESGGIGSVEFDSDHNVLMGHTRLSIIDLSSAGSQPMHNEDSSLWIIYNGEVYNFLELRKGLAGHRFVSNTDTEVILHAYEEYGLDFVGRLSGMFAFVILDLKRKRVVVARDHIGVKPLYIYRYKDTTMVSSEMRAILNLAEAPLSIDREAMSSYLALGYMPQPYTPFVEVRKAAPSEVTVIDLSAKELSFSTKRYWEFPILPVPFAKEPAILDKLDSLLYHAVEGSLISDVPVGIFLSGGVDSSIITYAASRMKSSPIKTFSVGFAEEDYDESKHSLQVSKICGTDHRHFTVDEDFLKFLPSVISSCEEPVADPASIPLWFLSREAAKEVKVVLSGEGGDELFGGYTRYFWDRMGQLYGHLPAPLRKGLSAIASLITDKGELSTLNYPRRIKKFLKSGELDHLLRYLSWFVYFSPEEIGSILPTQSKNREAGVQAIEVFTRHFNHLKTDDILLKTQYTDLRTMLLDNLLLKADKLSMAHSLEVRVPLLDLALVEFSLNLPPSLKVKRGTTKYLLKRHLEGKLPKKVFKRRKQGFEMPIGRWLREKGWADTARSIAGLGEYGLFAMDPVNVIVEEHRRGEKDLGRQVFSLLVLSIWFQKYANFAKIA